MLNIYELVTLEFRNEHDLEHDLGSLLKVVCDD